MRVVHPGSRAGAVRLAGLALAVTALTSLIAPTAAMADPDPDVTRRAGDVSTARALAACDSSGTTPTDSALATQLNGKLTAKMRGYMSAYRVSCARKVIEAVHDRGLHSRAAVIAITTTIIESSIDNIAEELDHDSLGLFQQRASWGSVSQRLNPVWATNAFLNKMLSKYPSNTWMTAQIGQICQAVQVSAYPDRYQPQAGDAQIIVNTIWPYVAGGAGRDFSGDGKADVIARNATTKDLHLYRGNGTGGFQSGTGEAFSNNWSAFDTIFRRPIHQGTSASSSMNPSSVRSLPETTPPEGFARSQLSHLRREIRAAMTLWTDPILRRHSAKII